MNSAAIAAAFIAACQAELAALKPGNVHIYASGHDMTVADFESSAEAAAPYIAASGASVGDRVFGAVTASLNRVGLNTNLGIVLLCAPLAAAHECASPGMSLRMSINKVLDNLNDEDARKVYAAIAAANPGGLGSEPHHDVRNAPNTTLLEAMRLAASRDRIALQYVTGFADIFDVTLPLAESLANTGHADIAIAEKIYWRLLTTFDDSHIARKYGTEKAGEVRREALDLEIRLQHTQNDEQRMGQVLSRRDQTSIAHPLSQRDQTSIAQLLAFDARLKSRKINPGTSADLTVSTLFAQKLQNP